MPKKRLTLEEVKNRLAEISPSIEILSDEYINNNTKLKCKCTKCDNIWLARWSTLNDGSGCHLCAVKRQTLTIEEVKNMLSEINPNITILSDKYVNNRVPLKVQCNLDGHIWYKPWAKLKSGIGCAKCSKTMKYTLGEIKERLKVINPNVTILSDEYIGSESKLDVKCNVCNNEWKIKWSKLNEGVGCPICATNNKKISFDDVKFRLSKINDKIELISTTYRNAKSKLDCRCTICGNEWKATWDNLSHNSGCPECLYELTGWTRSKWIKLGQQSKNFKSFSLYILECYDDNEQFYKIGITFVGVYNRYNRERDLPYNYKILKIIESEDGEYIWDLEKFLLREHRKENLKYYPLIPFGGSKNECFSELLDIDELLKNRKEV